MPPKKITAAKPTIYAEYLQLTTQYESIYGAKTVLLMMVGSFYEVYGLKTQNGNIIGSCISEFCALCNLSCAEKQATHDDCQVLMAGFRDYMLEKYLTILSSAGYTSVIYNQIDDGTGKFKRELAEIVSAGTYIPIETPTQSKLSNYIMCICSLPVPVSRRSLYEKMIVGVSFLNIYTGKSHMFEFTINGNKYNSTSFDELEKNMSIYNPCEILFVHEIGDTVVAQSYFEKLKQFTGIQEGRQQIHIFDNKNEMVLNCGKQVYIEQIIGQFFGEDAYNTCEEFQTMPVSTQSYCFLLNFVQNHNPNLTRKVALPVFSNEGIHMRLANHTLKQLNILDSDDSDSAGNLSSVSRFLNQCITTMGRRELYNIITHPVYDVDWLNTEYAKTEYGLNHYHYVELFRSRLKDVYDVEKIARQIMIEKIQPISVYRLWSSFDIFGQLLQCIYEEQQPFSELFGIHYGAVDRACQRILDSFQTHFIQENEISNTYTSNKIMNPNAFPVLRDLLDELRIVENEFDAIVSFLNMLMRFANQDSNVDDYVKINRTEKSGVNLEITKSRGRILKQTIDTAVYFGFPAFQGILKKESAASNRIVIYKGTRIEFTDFKLVSGSSNIDDIEFYQLTNLCKKMLNISKQIQTVSDELFYGYVAKELKTNMYDDLCLLSETIKQFDIFQCRAYLANQYGYCKPLILATDDINRSSVEAKQLRHCLIEHINQKEIYIPNDIVFNDSQGILLYGTNAVGKTSLIRALGIAIIMAQSGFYVPCTQFHYRPYRSIFSRILGNDNLFKSLSTFAVEMSELRVILNSADQYSMVLGDELCSGTETSSALSIFVAGIESLLRNNKSNFIFATHFHEIVKYEEIQQMIQENILFLKHMSVFYDRQLDCLVYDRLLKDGAGDNMYGLEVCKSLYMPDDFMNKAFSIREKYFQEEYSNVNTLLLKSSGYNSAKLKGRMCEKCGNSISTEIHHLMMQKDSDSISGRFSTTSGREHIHKNHPANLMALCEKCHLSIHHVDTVVSSLSEDDTHMNTSPPQKIVKKLKKTKTTKGYIYKE